MRINFERRRENKITWYSHCNRPSASTSGFANHDGTIRVWIFGFQFWFPPKQERATGSNESTGIHQRWFSAYCRYWSAPDIGFVRFFIFKKTNKTHNRDDEVDHSYLLQLLYRKVKCRETLRLIRKWLRSPIQIEGKLVKRRKGVPQEGRALRKCLVDIFSEWARLQGRA